MLNATAAAAPLDPAATRHSGPVQWFADRRVGTKIAILLVALLLVAAGVGGAAVVQLRTVAAKADSIYRVGAVPLKDLAEAEVAIGGMRQRVLLHLAGPLADQPAREQQIAALDASFDEKITAFAVESGDEDVAAEYVAAVQTYRAYRDSTIQCRQGPQMEAWCGPVPPSSSRSPGRGLRSRVVSERLSATVSPWAPGPRPRSLTR